MARLLFYFLLSFFSVFSLIHFLFIFFCLEYSMLPHNYHHHHYHMLFGSLLFYSRRNCIQTNVSQMYIHCLNTTNAFSFRFFFAKRNKKVFFYFFVLHEAPQKSIKVATYCQAGGLMAETQTLWCCNKKYIAQVKLRIYWAETIIDRKSNWNHSTTKRFFFEMGDLPEGN